MAPLPWITLVEYLISLLAQIFSLYVFSYILFKRLVNNTNPNVIKSPCINFYFQTQIVTAFVNITYIIFFIICWRPNPTENNAYALFFFGTPQILGMLLSPLSIFGLGIDRCLAVLFPLKYTKRENSYPKYFSILLMFVFTVFAVFILFIPTFPSKSSTTCSAFGCMATKEVIGLFFYGRCFISVLIFVNSVTLVVLMRYKHNITHLHRKFNNLVLYTLLATLFLDFLPNLGGSIFTAVTGINLSTLIGPYATVTSCIETGICAYVYKNVYNKQSIHIKSIKPRGVSSFHS